MAAPIRAASIAAGSSTTSLRSKACSCFGARVDDVRAGDLVFFRTSGRGPTHVGIALGPDRFVHAPSARGEVRIEPLARQYWADRFVEARRVF
jgi:cell wall-associated NlpC family hydrolase